MQYPYAILSSVACPALQIVPHYFIKGGIFEKKLLNMKCAFRFSLQLLSETFFILRRNERDMIKNVSGFSWFPWALGQIAEMVPDSSKLPLHASHVALPI